MMSLPVTSMQRVDPDATLVQLGEGPAAVGRVRGHRVLGAHLTGQSHDGTLLGDQMHPGAPLEQETNFHNKTTQAFKIRAQKTQV